MKDVISDATLVARCGLYCGACGAYLKDRCPACHGNAKATWCTIRSCCMQKNIATCADCGEFPEANDCRKFNTVISKVFGFLFRSNRAACIRQIREIGVQGHADRMAREKQHSIRR